MSPLTNAPGPGEAIAEEWRLWGPYLADRQWGTVREDYSPGGSAWEAFPHDHARSRVYRWGEDGLWGFPIARNVSVSDWRSGMVETRFSRSASSV